MEKKTCTHCAGSAPFDAELAFATLAKQHHAVVDVISRFMEASTTQQLQQRSLAHPASSNLEALQREFKRILGGQGTTSYPECCLVGHRSTNDSIGWFCSGVLVHPRIVLTAGHCFVQSNRANVVALATSDQNQMAKAEVIGIKRLVVNPHYQPGGPFDMTVLILRSAATTAPVAPAAPAEFAAASRVTLVGFGNDDANSTRGFGTKREVDVDVISRRITAQDKLDADEQHFGYESDLEFVAGGGGFDTCNGDSGGPVYIHTDAGNRLVGLTSRATEGAKHNCGDGGIYTRVDAHLEFIRSVATAAEIADFV